MRVIASLLLGAIFTAGQSVEGVVTDAYSGAGLPNVKVQLLLHSLPFYEATTDGAGRFLFESLNEAQYSIAYSAPGHTATGQVSSITVKRGAKLRLETRLVPLSGLSGVVLGSNGNRVPRARLELRGAGLTSEAKVYLRTSWGEGGGPLTDAPKDVTYTGLSGPDGAFALRLTPGAYTLTVAAPEGAPPPERKKDGPPLTWGRSEPLHLTVRPGAVLSGVQLRLAAFPSVRLRGQVRTPDGVPAPHVAVVLEDIAYPLRTQTNAAGMFEFPSAPAGEICLSAQLADARAFRCFQAGPQDVRDLRLDLAEPLELPVAVQLEGNASDAPPWSGAILFRPVGDFGPLPAHIRQPLTILLPNAGKFVLKGAYPGRYRAELYNQSPQARSYVSALLAGGEDVLRGEAWIAAGQSLTVVLRSDSGSLQGHVRSCGFGGVLLVPRDPSLLRRGWSRAAGCDASDNYHITGIPPGEFVALALSGNSPVPLLNEWALQQGQSIRIRPGQTASLDLSPASGLLLY